MQPLTNERLELLMHLCAKNELSQPIDDAKPHPAEDVDLIEAWSLGELEKSQVDGILDHLADCAYCRRSIAAMCHDDLLTFAPAETGEKISLPTQVASPASSRHPHRLFIAAAAILVISVIGVWMFRSQGTDVARSDLVLKQNRLTDYGYDLRGMLSGIKGGDESDIQKERRFRDQMAQNPDDVKLRFEFGQWLLAEYRLSDAIAKFEEVEKVVPNSAAVQNALGMAWFMKETGRAEAPKVARGYFLKASQLAPADKGINLNLAICLTVLGDDTGAKKYFEKAGVSQ
ncbi:MAG: hypothetical protein FWC50_07035 [Planctomycetaceae bacterium]|nr:hypothetical protein [Planctomycetaceae bacterium]